MPNKRMSKSQFVSAVAEKGGLSKKQASAAIDAIQAVIVHQLGKKGPGEFVLPGLLKMTVIKKPAVPARKGINPFTKEPTVFKAKPARKVVKVRPLKALKDAV